MRSHFRFAGALAAVLAMAAIPARSAVPSFPRYEHVIVIVEENKSFGQIIGHPAAPALTRLARTYGHATAFYGEVHPSEGNYVAMLGGDNFGIHDDDAFYCKAGVKSGFCHDTDDDEYPNHTVSEPSLMSQLEARKLTWRGYFESIPVPGSLAIVSPNGPSGRSRTPNALYAAKHNGFLNFASVSGATPGYRAEHLVGFDRLQSDLASGAFPHYAMVIPNQCNDMHGLSGANVPADCKGDPGRITRGDAYVSALVARIQRSPIWRSPKNTAIVITWDEDNGFSFPVFGSNGGGHIATIVITNHGPRGGIEDATPANHYALLRTIEEAFGIDEYLRNAAGAESLPTLFAVR